MIGIRGRLMGMTAAVAAMAYTAQAAATAEDLPAPVRPAAVVRVLEVIEKYEYRVDRQKAIDAELEPAKRDLELLSTQLRQIEEDIRAALAIAPDENNPRVRDLATKRQRAEFDLREQALAGEEKERALLVQMIGDVYNFFNMACRDIAIEHGFGIMLTGLDPVIDDRVLAAPQTTPAALMQMILMRSIQYAHPQHCDMTAFTIHTLNTAYRKYQQEQAAGNRNAPIYQAKYPRPAVAR